MVADGIHSVVRQHLHGQQPTRYAGYFAWRGVADFDYPEYRPGSWQMSLGRGSQFGYMPLTNGRAYWFGTKNSSSRRVDKVNAKQAALDFFAILHAPVRDVISATADVLCNPIIDRPPLKSWGKGRITLLGDAAHATTPNLGQGACQAMEDAVVLAQALSVQRDISSALRMYEQARIPRTSGVINESYRIGQVLQLENDFVRRMRDRLLRLTLGTWLDTGMKYADFKVGTVAC